MVRPDAGGLTSCLFLCSVERVREIENMRHKVIESRQEVFNHNEHEVSKRWAFEEGVSYNLMCSLMYLTV